MRIGLGPGTNRCGAAPVLYQGKGGSLAWHKPGRRVSLLSAPVNDLALLSAQGQRSICSNEGLPPNGVERTNRPEPQLIEPTVGFRGGD
jgi:hypothetical protein